MRRTTGSQRRTRRMPASTRRGMPRLRMLPMGPRLLLGIVLAAGCGGEARDAGAEVTSVDSAGVVIVENQSDGVEEAAAWSLSPEPVLELGGGASPDVPLNRVAGIAPLDGGGVVVGTASPARVLVFDGTGERTATLGGQGGGPGEFMRVGSVVSLGDSVAVWDPDRRRLSVFSIGGELLRDVDLSAVAPISPESAPNTRTPAAFTRLLPAGPGSLILFAVGAFGPELGVRRPASLSYRVALDGEVLDTLGRFPGYQSYRSERLGVTPYPFGADTHVAWTGESLVVGTAHTTELRYHTPEGRLERIVRWPSGDRTVQGRLVEEWEASRDEWIDVMPPRRQEMVRAMFDEVPPPDRFPAYDGVLADDHGRVWVGDYAGQLSLPATPINRRVPARRWLVLAPNGAVTATVRTPEGFEPRAIHGERVWGVFRDELDVESVRVYTLTKE